MAEYKRLKNDAPLKKGDFVEWLEENGSETVRCAEIDSVWRRDDGMDARIQVIVQYADMMKRPAKTIRISAASVIRAWGPK